MKIIELFDGFNGHKAKFFAAPIERDGDLVKLNCAEPGKEYMIRWARIADVAAAELHAHLNHNWNDAENCWCTKGKA